MPAITSLDLSNAKLDVDHIAAIATSTNNYATDRSGNTKLTVVGAVNTLKAFNMRGARSNGTTYNLKDIYTEAGISYVTVVPSFVSVSVSSDLAAGYIAVHQGLTEYRLSQLDGATLMGYQPPGVGSVTKTVAQMFDNVLFASSKGFSTSNTAAQNLTALQNAFDTIYAGGIPSVVKITKGYYYCDGPLVYNPLLVQIQGDGGVTLDFSSVGSGWAIKPQSPYTAGESVSRNKIRWSGGFTVKGAATTNVMDLSSTGGVDNSCLTFKHIHFDTFAEGIRLGANSWQLTVEHYSFVNGSSGSRHINELSDATEANFGECNRFLFGIHSGLGTAHRSRNYNSDSHFIGVSFDCAQWEDLARGARSFHTNCHYETAADIGTLISVDGDVDGFAQTRFSVRDGTLILPGTYRTTPVFSCANSYPVTGGGIFIEGLAIGCSAGFTLPNNKLINGDGPVHARGITFGYQAPTFAIANSINQTSSGGFEQPNFATTDFTALDNSLPPTIDSTVFRSVANSMKMVANGSAFVGASLTTNVRPGQRAFFNLYYKLASVSSGAFFVIVTQILDRKGAAIVLADNVVFSGTNDWTYYSNTNLRTIIMPPGADKLLISVKIASGGGTGTAWVDDLSLNVID